jgi:hypothetical protein
MPSRVDPTGRLIRDGRRDSARVVSRRALEGTAW